jgi:hypothetical protein
VQGTLSANGPAGTFNQAAWCDDFPWLVDEKPGLPCACIDDALGCNPLLDPAYAQKHEGGWCEQFDVLEPSPFFVAFQDKKPCNCVPFYLKVQYGLLAAIVAVTTVVLSFGIIYVWFVVTPLWIEFAVHGVDNRQPGHLASARIRRQNKNSMPLLLLERKLGRQLRKNVLKSWHFHPPCHRLTRGLSEVLTIHGDYVHLVATDGVPFCCMRSGVCITRATQSFYTVVGCHCLANLHSSLAVIAVTFGRNDRVALG